MTLPQNVKDALLRVQIMCDDEAERSDIGVTDWPIVRAHLLSQEAEISELRQGYWDARAVMGFDNGGDPTPRAVTSSFAAMMKSDAESMRRDYDESLRESDSAESRLAAANALLRECYEWLFESLSDGPRVSEGAIEKHYYTPLLEAFHGRIQSHLQGAGDEA